MRIGAYANRANTYLLTGNVARAERDVAEIAPEIGKAIAPDGVPAMTVLLAQARIDAAHGRWSEAIARVTRVIEFFDGRP